MTESSNGHQPAPDKETLSQLIARILDQLSVSAWLPAGVLVFLILLVGSLRASDGHVGDALRLLGDLSASALVLLFIAVILTTVMTQAFQFEAIRLLEGYWGPRPVMVTLAERRRRTQAAKRDALWGRMSAIEDRAHGRAIIAMIEEGVPLETIELVRKLYRGDISEDDLTESQRDDVTRHSWEAYAPTGDLRRLDTLAAAGRRYPETDLGIRSTLLGNTLAAYEDPVEERIRGPIEDFVQRVFHRLPTQTQVDHDHFRSRLDLYCSLVIVFVLDGVIAVATLAGVDVVAAVVSGVIAVLLALLSYRAAVTSARLYGTMLNTIAALVGEETADRATS